MVEAGEVGEMLEMVTEFWVRSSTNSIQENDVKTGVSRDVELMLYPPYRIGKNTSW